jgi:hypothetical protein
MPRVGYYSNRHLRQAYGPGECRTTQHRNTISCGRVEGGAARLLCVIPVSLLLGTVLVVLPGSSPRADESVSSTPSVIAQGTEGEKASGGDEKPADEKKLSPEEKMLRRFPQPVKVGDLIGLPVLDWDDLTIGHVRHVVRTPAGKIQLVVTYGGWFGWGQRLVPVPIEVTAILARQIAALDMPRAEFDKAPTWSESQTMAIAADEMIKIAVTRR